MHVFFVVKLTELQHLNQHVHLFAKKSTISALRVYLANSSGRNLDIWGVDSNFLVRTASTSCDLLAPFWLKDMTTFFWGGEVIGTNGGCAPTMLIDYPTTQASEELDAKPGNLSDVQWFLRWYYQHWFLLLAEQKAFCNEEFRVHDF